MSNISIQGSGGGGGGRTILTGNLSLFVNASIGSDSYNGLSATYTGGVNGPWATPQHAEDVISGTLDKAGFDVIVNIAAGTVPGVGLKSDVGGGRILFLGAGSGLTTMTDGPNDGVYNQGETISAYVGVGSVIVVDFMTLDNSGALGNTIFFGAPISFQQGQSSSPGDVKFSGNGTGIELLGNSIYYHVFFGNYAIGSANIAFFWLIHSGATVLDEGLWDVGSGTLTINNTLYQAFCCIGQFSTGGAYGNDNEGSGSGYSGTLAAPSLPFFLQYGAIVNSGDIGVGLFPGTLSGFCDPSSSFDGTNDPNFSVVSPSSGDTVTMGYQHGLVLTPAATLATLNIDLPPIASLESTDFFTTNWKVSISSTQIITALTVATTDGATVVGAPTAMAANGSFAMIYDVGANTWYPSA
jgi:hypothetical protein